MQAKPYWIPGPWRGNIAILLRPRGGDWLEDDIASWWAHDFDVIVSLLTIGEMYELALDHEQALLEQYGMQFLNLPIPDRSVPDSLMLVQELIQKLSALLKQGKQIGIHCRQGVGRSSMITAILLSSTGMPAEQAFQHIQVARGCPVPDTEQQRQWGSRLVEWERLFHYP